MRKLRAAGTVGGLNPTSSVSVLEQITDLLRGLHADLSQVITEYNREVQPVLGTLPQGRMETRWDLPDDTICARVNGLDGKTIFVDNSATSSSDGGRYWRSDLSRPKTLKEALAALHTEISTEIDSLRAEIGTTASSDGISPSAKARIGINIFDSSQTSASDSLDGLTQTNQANILQLAKDLYDDLYDSLTGDGNPLLGNWKHAGAGVQEQQQVITFTPSTMVIDGRRVTVVYQIRPDKVRVSASRKAIVYDLVDENTIRYRDDDGNVFVLKRVDGGG